MAFRKRMRVSSKPVVSIIIPARNEEVCLGACLESLLAQRGVPFEVIVVDDGSTDRTRPIAESYPAVRVMSAPPLPAGWCGKSNAVAFGARKARADWFLFTDADTIHEPGSLRRAIQEAERNSADLLSYSPRQVVKTFWERAVMPVVFGELAVTFRPREVSDPALPAAAANGQYLLIRRSAYEMVGGHSSIAQSLLDDVDLARSVKETGGKLLFRYGGDAVKTRMYRNFAQLREGWTKNLALLFPDARRLAARRTAEFAALVSSVGAAAIFGAFDHLFIAGVFSVVALITGINFFRRIRKAHSGITNGMLAICGLPMFAWLLRRSVNAYIRGEVQWKGRSYGVSDTELPEDMPLEKHG